MTSQRLVSKSCFLSRCQYYVVSCHQFSTLRPQSTGPKFRPYMLNKVERHKVNGVNILLIYQYMICPNIRLNKSCELVK